MATKDDLANLKSELKSDIHDFRMDVKSSTKDIEDSIEEIKNNAIDLTDTVIHQDKRIEKLENKVFA